MVSQRPPQGTTGCLCHASSWSSLNSPPLCLTSNPAVAEGSWRGWVWPSRFCAGWVNVDHGLLPWLAPCHSLLCWWQSWGLLLKRGASGSLGRGKSVHLDRMEWVGLEGSLELWTVEREGPHKVCDPGEGLWDIRVTPCFL